MPAQRRMKLTIPITHTLAPTFNLLVFFARSNGEIVADFVGVKVECDLKEKVKERIIYRPVYGMCCVMLRLMFTLARNQPSQEITLH